MRRSGPVIRLAEIDLLPYRDAAGAGCSVIYLPGPTSVGPISVPVTAAAYLCCLSAAGAAAITLPNRPSFSDFSNLFPNAVPGLDQELGVTVLSRQQPSDIRTPIHAGDFAITPEASQGISYDDNVLGFKGSPASAISNTTASIGLNSLWSRDRVGAYVGVANSTYLDTPRLSRTDYTAALGGGLTLGRGEADIGFSHLSLHEDPTTIGALATSTPVPFTVDDVRADYNIPFGRLTVSPNLDYSQWRYGTTTIGGVSSNQSYRDRDVLQGGSAFRYQTGEEWSLLATAAAINTHYVRSANGIPEPNSTSYVVMGGFDYQITGPIRVRALAGVEGREFTSKVFKDRTTPVGRLDVVWTPTGLTTVTGTLSRSIEDPAQQDTGNLTLTRAQVAADHELRRDILLRGAVGGETVEYNQRANNQFDVFASVGATYIVTPAVQLLADYQFVWQSGGGTTTNPSTGAQIANRHFGRDIMSVKVRVAI